MKKSLLAVIAIAVLVAFAVPALAANPFMDVPANHWAYDAVAQLASRGILSGYPDGSYKGAQPATRYEMASALARAMAKVDMEKASKQDVELLKKLIVEFKDELDALGVKVDKIDARLAVMEKDLGGWSLSGQFRFDAKFGGNDYVNGESWYGDDMTMVGKNEFDLNRYRLYISKRVNETTNFTARLGANGNNASDKFMEWEEYYITTKLGYDITMTAGKRLMDWEGDAGMYQDNDAWIGDWRFNQIGFAKTWGMANMNLVFGRVNDAGTATPINIDGVQVSSVQPEWFMVAAHVNANFSEKFRAGLLAYYFFADEEIALGTVPPSETDTDLLTLGAYMAFAFTPSIELKALYYTQSLGDSYSSGFHTLPVGTFEDSPAAWKVMLDVKQEALKFTSLWLEYGQIDNTFIGNQSGLTNDTNPYAYIGAEPLANQPWNNNSTTVMLARANQKWNDKWSSYLRYFVADFDTAGIDDASNWTVGVGYQLNPNVSFELAYDNIDYGDSITRNEGGRTGDDHLVRFRTYVTF